MQLRYPVVLASGSPRRRELLKTLVAEFSILAPNVDEALIPGESPVDATVRLAVLKARAAHRARPEALVVAGDTLVALETEDGWEIFGKPADADDAREMLRRLSGRTHMVTTGVCLAGPEGEAVFSDQSRVAFRELSADEIADYVATGESLDKAGSYAIQGAAAPFIVRIEGSLTNVVGLPTERLEQALATFTASNSSVMAARTL